MRFLFHADIFALSFSLLYYLQVYTVYRHIASFVDCESRIVATQPRLGSGLEGHIEITVE
jgi:hypothetical protein